MKRASISFHGYLRSSVGQKFLMAVSGVVLVGFILTHLLGNLQMFSGPEEMNGYAAFLKGTGELLWGARIFLLLMVGIHIWTAVSLTLENRAARPIAYGDRRYLEASYASRTMHWSGFIVLGYLIYHLLHFTFLKVHPQFGHLVDPKGRHDVYSMVVLSFRQPLIAAVYIVCNLLLGMHLSHGLYSMAQSLGLQSEALRARWRPASYVLGYGIFLAYAAIPAAVWAGLVRLPPWIVQP